MARDGGKKDSVLAALPHRPAIGLGRLRSTAQIPLAQVLMAVRGLSKT